MSSIQVEAALGLPDVQMVEALAAFPETQWFERKSGRIPPKDLARPLIAFANAEGGTIVVGLHGGHVDGVTPQSENALRQAAMDFTVPPVRAHTTSRQADGLTLLIVRVEPSDTVHTTPAGECYLRVGDESRKLTLAKQQELTYDKGGQTFEAQPVHLELDDLDEQQLEAYRETVGASSVERLLSARDLVDRRGRVTVAAELLFDERPQREFPSAYVRMLRFDGDERGLGSAMTLREDIRVEGSLPHQIIEAITAIDGLIPRRQQLRESGRFEPVPVIPRDAWLEGLVNAVVHRSYSVIGDHIRVEIFDHRLEITSPGRFPGLVDLASPQAISRYARNPRIARVFADLGFTRELGEGIKRIFDEMRGRGLTEPIYRQSASSVTLTLSATDAVDPAVLDQLTKAARDVLTTLRLAARPLGTGQIAELTGIARPTAKRALDSLAAAGLVEWHGTSDRDPRATWRLL